MVKTVPDPIPVARFVRRCASLAWLVATAASSCGQSVQPDASARDASADHALDGPAVDARAGYVLLTGAGASARTIATSYRDGAWAPVTSFGDPPYLVEGGGVTVLRDGRGLAFLFGGRGPVAALWDGAWSAPTPVGTIGVQLTAPVATAHGALAADTISSLDVDTFDAASGTWTSEQPPPLWAISDSIVLVTTADDAPLLMGTSGPDFRWSLRTGTTWSPFAVIPGLLAAQNAGPPYPDMAAVRRVGDDQIVAVFATQVFNTIPISLRAATFTAGAWSTPTLLASDGAQPTGSETMQSTPYTAFSLAALADGRVALAYPKQAPGMAVGFFDGTRWTSFRAVPTAANAIPPVAVTRGVAGAVLEVAYLDAGHRLWHTRLMDEATWSWTPSTMIDDANPITTLALATGP